MMGWLLGYHYYAVVRFDYDDWHGRDFLTIKIPKLRARDVSHAASKAITIAQRESSYGWISVHVYQIRLSGNAK